jgi:hypothetical protein
MPSKRRRSSPEGSGQMSTNPGSIASIFVYEEIFLRILSFLSPTDLALVQGVNKYWARMSLDPQVSRHCTPEVDVSHAERDFLILLYPYSSGNVNI